MSVTDYRIVPSEPAHVAMLAVNLRDADRAEVQSAGLSSFKAIGRSFRSGILCRTAFVGDDIAAMWGLGGTLVSNVGHPWLLTTPAVEKIPIAFVKEAQAQLAIMLALRPVLSNYVAASYGQAIGFLRLLGFEVGYPIPFGPRLVPFRKFERRR